MGDFQPIESSNLEAAAYDERAATLTVKFRGGATYIYRQVLKSLWIQFSSLFDGRRGSAGQFFNRHIRSLPNEKVEEEDND